MSESIHPPRKNRLLEISSGIALLAVVAVCVGLHWLSVKRNNWLMAAIDWNDAPKITRLLREGADPRTRSGGGRTVLVTAAERGDLELTEMALTAGADVNMPTDDGQTVLHYALHPNAKIKALQLQLDRGASLTATTSRGATPLHYSVTANHVEGTKLLLRAGARIDAQDDRGETPSTGPPTCNTWGAYARCWRPAQTRPCEMPRAKPHSTSPGRSERKTSSSSPHF